MGAYDSVPNRAPKYKVKDISIEPNVARFSGEFTWRASHPDFKDRYYSGYSKKEAKKQYREYLDGKE
jgi:hypothetical protein